MNFHILYEMEIDCLTKITMETGARNAHIAPYSLPNQQLQENDEKYKI